MSRRPESPNALLIQSSGFRALLVQVEKHERLLRIARAALPSVLGEHCKACLSKEGRIVIFADSPAWATQLRFFGPAILASLRSCDGENFREVQVRNLTRETIPDESRSMNLPSPEVARMVRMSAIDAPTDELRAALMRLGATIERYAGRK